jgi:hypothetical protein
MRRNQLHALAIWTSNTFLLVNGLNMILWCWKGLIPPSTYGSLYQESSTESLSSTYRFYPRSHSSACSPVYRSIIGRYVPNDEYVKKFVPSSFTAPLTAAAAHVHAPIPCNYTGNPWTPILGHGLSNPLVSLSSCLVHSGLWAGVIVDT